MRLLVALAVVLVALLLLSWSSSLALLFGVISVEIVFALILLRQLLASARELPRRAAVRALFWGCALGGWGCVAYLVHGCLAHGGVEYLFSPKALTVLEAGAVLIGLAATVLAFLNRLTVFPGWTRIAGVAALSALVAAVVDVAKPHAPSEEYEAFAEVAHSQVAVAVRAVEAFRNGRVVSDETYDIVPTSAERGKPLRVDREWLRGEKGLQVVAEAPIRVRGADPCCTAGLEVTCRRTLSLRSTRVGLLRKKVALPSPDLMIDFSLPPAPTGRWVWMPDAEGKAAASAALAAPEDGPPPYSDQPSASRAFRADWLRPGDLSGHVAIDLPDDLYLASLPAGKLTVLPDRDHLDLDAADAAYGIELYYLSAPRIQLLRTLLGQGTRLDLALKVVTFLFWPVALLLVAAAQQAVRDRVMLFFRRGQSKSQAGF